MDASNSLDDLQTEHPLPNHEKTLLADSKINSFTDQSGFKELQEVADQNGKDRNALEEQHKDSSNHSPQDEHVGGSNSQVRCVDSTLIDSTFQSVRMGQSFSHPSNNSTPDKNLDTVFLVQEQKDSKCLQRSQNASRKEFVYDETDEVCVREQSKAALQVDLEAITKRLKGNEGCGLECYGTSKDRMFTAKINPSSNSEAEAELRKQIR